MIESKPEVREMIERLYAVAGELRRGEVLTHEAVRDVLGCEPHTLHWPHCVNVVRRRLERERGIATWPTTSVGYKLLTTREQLEQLPLWRHRKAQRQERRARKSLNAIPTTDLTPHQQRVRAAQIEAIAASQRAMRLQAKAHASVVTPPSRIPVRRVLPHMEAARAAQPL